MRKGERQFRSLEATELFCPRCRRATPVRKNLLLVLPSGDRYDLRCGVCGTSVGDQTEEGTGSFDLLRP